MKIIIICMGAFIFLFTSFSCGTSVSDYEPKNQAEKEIKALLIDYLDCRNNHDFDRLCALFHDDAKVKLGRRPYVTKSQLRETWSEDFESWPTVEITNPEIKVAENKASVKVDIDAAGIKLDGAYDLVKENDRWLILKFTAEGRYASPR